MNPLLPIRVVLADDHELIRNGFRNILQKMQPATIEFVAEAKNGEELFQAVSSHHPQLVLTDIQMPVMNGFEACRLIKKHYPQTNVVAFSMFTDTQYIMEMLRAGANGYLAKTSSSHEIYEAIQVVSTGRSYYCSTVSEKLYGKVSDSVTIPGKIQRHEFSVQEREVMRLICHQLCAKEIAAQMSLAVRTVENYRTRIQEKLGARNMVGIALYAVINDMVNLLELEKGFKS